jgi:hypothetical protein
MYGVQTPLSIPSTATPTPSRPAADLPATAAFSAADDTHTLLPCQSETAPVAAPVGELAVGAPPAHRSRQRKRWRPELVPVLSDSFVEDAEPGVTLASWPLNESKSAAVDTFRLAPVHTFDQRDLDPESGHCFAACVEWAGRVIAGSGADPGTLLTDSTARMAVIGNQAQYAKADDDIAQQRSDSTRAQVQSELAAGWLREIATRGGAARRQPLPALPCHVDEHASLQDFKTQDAAADLAAWAAARLDDDLRGWQALLISSDSHTVAVARVSTSPQAEIYAFDPNAGTWRLYGQLPECLGALAREANGGCDGFLPSMVLVAR